MGFYGLSMLGGLFLFGVCFKYLYLYFSDFEYKLRHEYLQGAAIVVMLSIPCWILASVAVLQIQSVVPRIVFLATNTVTVVVCTLFLFANFYPLIMKIFGK
jgi:CHASE2 domain-containing sensor protein